VKRRICFVSSGRYDWTRCQTVIEALEQRNDAKVLLIACGAHLSEKHGFTLLGLEGHKINFTLKSMPAGDSPEQMARACGRLTVKLSKIFGECKPDMVVAVTDRWEALSTATAAALMNIPVIHVQGGEVSGTIDESIRHTVTKLAHWHFPATEKARDRIICMGEDPEAIWNFGCPGTDLLLRVDTQAHPREIPYALLLMHPVTTEYGQGLKQAGAVAEATLSFRSEDFGVIMVGPNHDAGSRDVSAGLLESHPNIPHVDFIQVMANAFVMVGNSSAGIREAGYFGTPVVNVGSRQSGRERGANVLDSEPTVEAVSEAIKVQLAHGRYPPKQLYGDGTAGPQIAEILASHPLPGPQKRIGY